MAATILVTGSSTGFGRLTVETLARQGYTVFAGIRDITGKNQTVRDELRALAENEQLALDVVEQDVTNDLSVGAAVQHIVAAT
jgi:NAD(P)-dependent dehydrogenase (short-subunit alcohol dehydrogenase family)